MRFYLKELPQFAAYSIGPLSWNYPAPVLKLIGMDTIATCADANHLTFAVSNIYFPAKPYIVCI